MQKTTFQQSEFLSKEKLNSINDLLSIYEPREIKDFIEESFRMAQSSQEYSNLSVEEKNNMFYIFLRVHEFINSLKSIQENKPKEN